MKEFNLEEAKEGKPVCTRSGLDAEIITFESGLKKHPIVASIGCEELSTVSYTNDGRYLFPVDGNTCNSHLDLMMKEEELIKNFT